MYDASAIEEYTTPCGLKRYRLPVVYTGLNRHRYISSDLPEFAIHKATLQEMLWSVQAESKAALKRKRLGLEMNAKRPDLKAFHKHKIAEGRTELARHELSCSYKVLSKALDTPLDYDWEFMRKCPPFPVPKPVPPTSATAPVKPTLPREPLPTDFNFLPKFDAMDKLIQSRRAQKEQAAQSRFQESHKQWEQMCVRIRQVYAQQLAQYNEANQKVGEQYQQQLRDWESAKEHYYRQQAICVEMVEHKKAAYLEHEPHAVLDYFDIALAFSSYPPCFPQTFDLDYDSANRLLIVDYLLPSLKVLPRLAKVVYNEIDNVFADIILTEDERNTLYARLLHEMPLRTFHELFNADGAVSLASIRFRGYLFLDENKESGKPPSCVVDVQTDRAGFANLDLYHGDPILLFEELGGVIKSLP